MSEPLDPADLNWQVMTNAPRDATRSTLFATLFLVFWLSPSPAPAVGLLGFEHEWIVEGPGGHYGLAQYTTGPGPLDSHTGIVVGQFNLDFPFPAFVLFAMVAGGFALLTVLLVNRFRNKAETSARQLDS